MTDVQLLAFLAQVGSGELARIYDTTTSLHLRRVVNELMRRRALAEALRREMESAG